MSDETTRALVESLLEEETLFQVWKSSRKVKPSRTTVVWTTLTAILLTLSLFFPNTSPGSLAEQTRVWADLGLSFSITILGFLIAGFTIFASLGRAEMFCRMAELPHDAYDQTGFSFLKDAFLRLLRVLSEYWFFTMVCLAVKIFGYANGPLAKLLHSLPPTYSATNLVASASYVLMGTAFIYILMILQSFIFNIHNFVMTGVSWDIHVQNQITKVNEDSSTPISADEDSDASV